MSNLFYNALRVDLIKSNGYFNYLGYNFYKNGNIINVKNRRIVANIIDANNNNKIGFGTNFSNLKSSIQTSDPYEFVISNGSLKVRFLLFESGFDLKIQAILDHDVFQLLILYIIGIKKSI